MDTDGTSVLLDGGKRDRVVWPGDIVISGPSIFVSTNSLEPVRNALDSLFLYQESDGRLPYAGYPLAQLFGWSFTYHCHTLNDVFDYFMFTGNMTYLDSYWEQYKSGVDYVLQFIDSTSLANVTSTSDWGRNGMSGHNIKVSNLGVIPLTRTPWLTHVQGKCDPALHTVKCRQVGHSDE
jgi:hypothetical protein